MAAAVAVVIQPNSSLSPPDALHIRDTDVPANPRHRRFDLGLVQVVGKVFPRQQVVVGPEHMDRLAVEPAVQLGNWAGPRA